VPEDLLTYGTSRRQAQRDGLRSAFAIFNELLALRRPEEEIALGVTGHAALGPDAPPAVAYMQRRAYRWHDRMIGTRRLASADRCSQMEI
jgi:hypothetical protein